MKKSGSFLLFSLLALSLNAQTADPVVMKVGPNEVTRSEFQYFYRNNYSEDASGKGGSLMDYANIYADFKLKVLAAHDAGIDTTASFLEEFKEYRGVQAESYMLDSAYLENFARMTFQRSRDEVGPDGIKMFGIITVKPADETQESQKKAIHLIDSIWYRLGEGDDFRYLASKYSKDALASSGGTAGWFSRDQLPDVVANPVFSTEVGKYSRPFEYDGNYSLVMVLDEQKFDNFGDHREAIYGWMEQQDDIFPEAKLKKAEKLSEQYGWNLTPEEALLREDSLLEQLYPDFGNISREYHDGLLLFEISNREVWDKASQDSVGQLQYFNANRKKYKFENPMFKGMIFFCTGKDVFDEVSGLVKDLPYDDWTDAILDYNADGIKVRVMRGPIEKGRNNIADAVVFGENVEYDEMKGYPFVSYIGRILTKPEEPEDVAVQLVNDYQDMLESQWLKKLKKKYRIKIDKKVLNTVTLED